MWARIYPRCAARAALDLRITAKGKTGI